MSEGTPLEAVRALHGEITSLPSRTALARIFGATIGALLGAVLYAIPGMPTVAATFVFAALTLTGRQIGAWLAIQKLTTNPYAVSDWDHADVLTSRLLGMGVKPELAKKEAHRLVSIATDLEDLRSLRWIHRQLPDHVFAQSVRDEPSGLIKG